MSHINESCPTERSHVPHNSESHTSGNTLPAGEAATRNRAAPSSKSRSLPPIFAKPPPPFPLHRATTRPLPPSCWRENFSTFAAAAASCTDKMARKSAHVRWLLFESIWTRPRNFSRASSIVMLRSELQQRADFWEFLFWRLALR